MSETDNALAETAMALNEDAKASRKKKGATAPGIGDGGAAERTTTTAIERMENMATEAEFVNDSSLVFDVRDFLLDQVKHRPKAWSACSQSEQRDIAAACEHAATELVRKVVEQIAARGAVPVRVLLTKITSGDDIVISGKVKTYSPEETDAAIMLLHHQRGKHVMLTAASADDYRQGEHEADTDPDEPGLDFAAGGGDDSELAGEDEDQGED